MTDLWNSLQLIESDCGDPGSLKTKSAAMKNTTYSKYKSVEAQLATFVNNKDYLVRLSSN